MLFIIFFSTIANGESNLDSAPVTVSLSSPLLDRIALGEGTSDTQAQSHNFPSGYDVPLGYGQYGTPSVNGNPTTLSQMTLGEVQTFQQQMIDNGAPSGAVGKYQITQGTLADLKSSLGLSDDTPFNAVTQEMLGQARLEERGYSKWMGGEMSDHDFQKNLAKEWASVADPDTGHSYYGQGVGTTDTQIKEAMTQTKGAALTGASIGSLVTLTLYIHNGNTNGPVIPGAQVSSQDGSGNNFQRTADSSGSVTIYGMPGTWSFTVTAPGFETSSWNQDITDTCTRHSFLQAEPQQSVAPAQGSGGSVVGEWTLNYDWGCTGSPTKEGLYLKEDHTVSTTEGDTGFWYQTGDNIHIEVNTAGYGSRMPIYEGTIQMNTMSGAIRCNVCGDLSVSLTGCWSASKVSS
jgi:conjugal transfer mating pair stabilization protein TraG